MVNFWNSLLSSFWAAVPGEGTALVCAGAPAAANCCARLEGAVGLAPHAMPSYTPPPALTALPAAATAAAGEWSGEETEPIGLPAASTGLALRGPIGLPCTYKKRTVERVFAALQHIQKKVSPGRWIRATGS